MQTSGNTPPSVFLDNTSPIEISVFILDTAPNKELTGIGDDMAKQRSGNRSFYGWAEIPIVSVSKDNRKVRATPQPKNQWHADIVLPSKAEQENRERKRHANQLAKIAVPRPPVR